MTRIYTYAFNDQGWGTVPNSYVDYIPSITFNTTSDSSGIISYYVDIQEAMFGNLLNENAVNPESDEVDEHLPE